MNKVSLKSRSSPVSFIILLNDVTNGIRIGILDNPDSDKTLAENTNKRNTDNVLETISRLH